MNRKNAESARAAFLASEELFTDAILYLLQRAEKFDDVEARRQAQDLLSDSSTGHIRTASALRYLQRSGLVTGDSVSFRARVVESYDRYQFGDRDPSWFLDDKLRGAQFTDLLGAHHPLRGLRKVAFADIKPQSGIVVKLGSGSSGRGCFLVHQTNRIWDVAGKVELGSWAELWQRAASCLSEEGVDLTDPVWLVEDLLYRDEKRMIPARDYKVFCFYGEVGLVRAIDRVPSVRTLHWEPGGALVNALTKKENSIQKDVNLPDGVLELARRISLKIPSAFIRIDLLGSLAGFYVGEYTPWPGTFAVKSKEWDKRLGECWIKAEARLRKDLLLGKSFPEYMESTFYAQSQEVGFPT